MSEINKCALPPGALERHFGLICAMLVIFALWRQMGMPTYFFRSFDTVQCRRFCIIYQKMKANGPKPRRLWPFESTPGHPRQCLVDTVHSKPAKTGKRRLKTFVHCLIA